MSLFPRRTQRGPAPFMSAPLGLADHPEIIDRGDAFALACYRAIDYCAFHRTDGKIPRSVAARMFGAQLHEAEAIGFLVTDGNSLRVAQFLDVNLRSEQRRDSSTDSSTDSRAASLTGCKEKEKEKENKKEKIQDSVPSMSTSQERAAPAPPPQRTEAQLVVTQPELEPEPDPSTESPQDMAMRYMLTPSTRNDGGRDRVWRFYAVRYVVATQAKPTYPSRGKKQLDDLIRVHGVEEVCRRISIYFDDPPFRLRDGSRDFARFLGNFDLLASGSGNTSKHEAGDRTAEFKWNVRERIEQMNGAAPSLSAEFAKWIAPATFEDEERHAISGS